MAQGWDEGLNPRPQLRGSTVIQKLYQTLQPLSKPLQSPFRSLQNLDQQPTGANFPDSLAALVVFHTYRVDGFGLMGFEFGAV